MAGNGLTVTMSVNGLPTPQSGATGVTVYVAVCIELVSLRNFPLIKREGVDSPAPPVILGASGAFQVYVVPAGTIPSIISVGLTVNVSSLHIAVLIVLIATIGLTYTVKEKLVTSPQNGTLATTR